MTRRGWDLLEHRLRERGSRRVLRLERGDVSADEVLDRVHSASARLRSLGLAPGEPVGLVAETSAECVMTLLALWQSDLVAVPISPREPEEARARAVGGAADATLRCRLLLSPDKRAEGQVGLARHWPMAQLFATRPAALPQLTSSEPRQTIAAAATVLRTSGSTGTPKMAVHALDHHVASAKATLHAIPLGSEDTWLLALPLHHVGGLGILFRAVLAGASIAIASPGQDLIEALEYFRPTHLSLVSTQLVRLLGNEDAKLALTRTKAVVTGGGPFPVPLRRWALTAGIPLTLTYGSTESCSMVTTENHPVRLLQTGTAGSPLPGHVLRLADDGEILIGGETLFLGYLGADGIEDPRDENGLFATGDLGSLDPGNGLVVRGRKDELFISGGENIHPGEIESALCDLETVAEAVVVPVRHPDYGQRPAAFVRSEVGRVASREALVRHLEQRLPRFKIPDRFFRLPVQAPGVFKRDRASLRELAANPDVEPL